MEQARRDGLATPVTILQASQAGCVGIIFANEDRFTHNMIGTTIWGTPELDQLERMPTVAAVSASGCDSTPRRRSGDATIAKS